MNIVFAISTRNWGGVKTWMLNLGRESNRHQCRSFYYHADPRFGVRLDRAGLKNRRIRFGVDFSPRRIMYFVREFKSFRPDVVVTNIDKDDRSAGVAAWLTGVPVLKRIGSASDIKDNARIRWVQGRMVEGFICPARHIRSRITGFPWIDPAKVHVIANGVDHAPIPAARGEAFREAHAISGDVVAVGVASRLAMNSGHSILLKALAGLDDAMRRRIRLFVANDGVLRNDLADACGELGIADQVTFTGYLEETDGFFKAMDILVLPSLAEGLPNNLLEYLRADKPVIAADIPGVDEIIIDGENGLLFERGNAEELGRRLVRLIQTPDLRRTLAENGRRTIEDAFSLDRMAVQTLALMKAIVARRQGRGDRVRPEASFFP